MKLPLLLSCSCLFTAILFTGCEQALCDDTKTYGVHARMSGISLNIVYKKGNNDYYYPFKGSSGPVDMGATDTVVYGFVDHWKKESETKQCSPHQKEHSYYKMAGTRVRIRTVGDFDSSYPAGSDISAFFTTDNPYAMLDQREYQEEYGLKAVLPSFWLGLVRRPDPGKHRFRFIMFTHAEDDGISFTTPELEFVR